MKKQIYSIIALMLIAVSSAWADEPTVWTTAVNISELQEGDILAQGFSLTDDNDDGDIIFNAGRYKWNGALQTGDDDFTLINISSYGENGAITAYLGFYTSAPVDEYGDDGNAWVVTDVINNPTYTEIHLSGIYYDPNGVAMSASGDRTEWTMTMPAADVELTVRYFPDATVEGTATAATDVRAGDDKALVSGLSASGGSLVWAVTATTVATAPADDQFSADGNTAKDITTEGSYRVWYFAAGDAQHSPSDPAYTDVTVAVKTYSLIVGDKQVTEENQDDVLGDGKVTYDPTTHTLTLNDGASIGTIGGILYQEKEALTIVLNGTVTVNNTSGTAAISSSMADVTFVKGEGATSVELTLKANGDNNPISVTNYTFGSGLYEKPMAVGHTVITSDPEFVIVKGYAMTDGQVIGVSESSITFNATDKTLTFKEYHAALTSQIITGLTGLTVKMEGTSSVSAATLDYPFKALVSTASMKFVSVDGGWMDLATKKSDTLFEGFGEGKVTYVGTLCEYDTYNQVWRIGPLQSFDFADPFTNEGQVWATYYNKEVYDQELPEGVEAYIISDVGGESVAIEAVTFMAKGVPVLLKKTGTVGKSVARYMGTDEYPDGNLLRYADNDINTTGREYVLYNNRFIRATGTIPAGKCYIEAEANAARVLTIGTSTGITPPLTPPLEGAGDVYDIQGRKVATDGTGRKLSKGVYIINGKKRVIK